MLVWHGLTTYRPELAWHRTMITFTTFTFTFNAIFWWQVVVAALKFFLGSDSEEDADDSDSDTDTEVCCCRLLSVLTSSLLCHVLEICWKCVTESVWDWNFRRNTVFLVLKVLLELMNIRCTDTDMPGCCEAGSAVIKCAMMAQCFATLSAEILTAQIVSNKCLTDIP